MELFVDNSQASGPQGLFRVFTSYYSLPLQYIIGRSLGIFKSRITFCYSAFNKHSFSCKQRNLFLTAKEAVQQSIRSICLFVCLCHSWNSSFKRFISQSEHSLRLTNKRIVFQISCISWNQLLNNHLLNVLLISDNFMIN